MKKVVLQIIVGVEGETPETIGAGSFQFAEGAIKEMLATEDKRDLVDRSREIMRMAFESVSRDLFEPMDDDQRIRTLEILFRFAKALRRA